MSRYQCSKRITQFTMFAMEKRFSLDVVTDWAWNNTPLPIGHPSRKQIWRAWLVIAGVWSWSKLNRIDDEELMAALRGNDVYGEGV